MVDLISPGIGPSGAKLILLALADQAGTKAVNERIAAQTSGSRQRPDKMSTGMNLVTGLRHRVGAGGVAFVVPPSIASA